eukprot:9352461-Alexandrium_andersonii.AAC.2
MPLVAYAAVPSSQPWPQHLLVSRAYSLACMRAQGWQSGGTGRAARTVWPSERACPRDAP